MQRRVQICLQRNGGRTYRRKRKLADNKYKNIIKYIMFLYCIYIEIKI